MRMFISLLAAWIVASLAFALAWIRFSDWGASLRVVQQTFVNYGIVIGIFVFAIGLPLAVLLARSKIFRWWSVTGVAAAVGALLGGTTIPSVPGNPFAASFSPWNRDSPGMVGNAIPFSSADQWGSIAFGALIGGLLGATFWIFYVRVLRPDSSLEQAREG